MISFLILFLPLLIGSLHYIYITANDDPSWELGNNGGASFDPKQVGKVNSDGKRDDLSSSLQDAVKTAQKTANSLASTYPQYPLLTNMAIASRFLGDQGHGGTLSGQITCRDVDADGNLAMWTAAYGYAFEEMTPDKFIKTNANAETIEGNGGANMAVRFHLHVYKYRPDVQCIVHSHPMYSVALAQMGIPMRIAHMDVMAFYDDVQYLDYWPGIPFGNEEGEMIEKVLGMKHNAALLAHHGVLVTGKSLEEVVYRAYFFEKAAQMQILTMSANGGTTKGLPDTIKTFSEFARDWRISEGPVKAHYYSWVRQTIAKHQLDFV
jgi:L-fuculose-phosphate aldolase